MGWSDLNRWVMRGAVKATRPGIASTNRRRSGSFASLLDQVLRDESALDGLAFAYAELPEPERPALAHAVVQDATENDEVSMPISSYGYVHDGQNSSDWFGYFDFTVRCHCPLPVRTDAILKLSPFEQGQGSPLQDDLLVQIPSP